MKAFASLLCLLVLLHSPAAHADIYRWDNGQIIPGTIGITPTGGRLRLDHLDLSYADLEGMNLTSAYFKASDLSFAVVNGTNLTSTTDSHGLTKEQLYSTASYVAKDLRGIVLANNDLRNWDFSEQNLVGARLGGSQLTDAAFIGALVSDTGLSKVTKLGFTEGQLYSTASYQKKDLHGIELYGNDLRGWNFEGQNLTGAELGETRLDGVNIVGANLRNADLIGTRGLASSVYSSATVYNQWTAFGELDPVSSGWTLAPSPPGDFDANDVVDSADLDAISNRILGRSRTWWLPNAMFDLNHDSQVNAEDHRSWIKDLKHTSFGDSNLDGEFNSSDLIQVFHSGQYEDTLPFNSSWSTGDWNADGEFNSSDLIVALADGGYEAGPRAVVAAVPEPCGLVLKVIGLCGFWRLCRVQ